jgi:hypothetical protein
MLEIGDVMTDYIATTTTEVSVGPVSGLPRLDYLNSTCPRLLLEPQRTNFLLDNLSIIGNTGSGQATPIISPDGYENGRLPIPSSTASRFEFIFAGGIFASGTVLTYSWFVKTVSTPASPSPTTGQLSQFNVSENATAGTPTKLADYGNGWERWSVTYTIVDGSLQSRLRAYYGGIIGVGNSSVAYYGHQVEQGTYATSLIINQSAAVTRVADAASKTGISSLIGQTEGTLYWEGVRPEGGTDISAFSISDGTTNNEVTFRFTAADTVEFYLRSGGGQTVGGSYTGADLNQNTKIAFAYKANDAAVYVNGTLVIADNTVTVPTSLTALKFARGNDATPMVASVGQVLLFKTRLSNSDLAALTA